MKAGYRILAFCIPAAISNMVGVTLQHLREPEYPEFLYSLVSHWTSNWFMRVSLAHQIIHSCFSWMVLLMVGVSIETMSQSITCCLDVLLETFDQETMAHRNLNALSWKLELYSKLQKLMGSFNSLFRWPSFVQMALVIGHMCIHIYIPLMYWEQVGLVSAVTSTIDGIVVLFGITFTLQKGMSFVHTKSSMFQPTFYKMLAKAFGSFTVIKEPIWDDMSLVKSRTSPLAQLWESIRIDQDYKWKLMSLKVQAESCTPFGFESGIFFTVTMGTFLSLFYAVTTHLIIMLQLNI